MKMKTDTGRRIAITLAAVLLGLTLRAGAQDFGGSNLGGRLEGENFGSLPGFELETSNDPLENASKAIDMGRYVEAVGFAKEGERLAAGDAAKARAAKLAADIYAFWLRIPAEAAKEYAAYLKNYPSGADVNSVRLRYAQSLYDQGKVKDASKAFQDYFAKTPATDPGRQTAQVFYDDIKPVLEGKTKYVPPPPEAQVIHETGGTNPDVRVALVWKVDHVGVDCRAVCSVQGLPGTTELKGPASLDLSTFRAQKLTLTPKTDGEIYIEGKPYRGYVTVESQSDGLLAVNVLPVESYLRGVVPVEVSASWDDAAQRAQAVMARSYVLAQKIRRTGAPFDVYNTVLSQAYGGKSVEKDRSDKAVSSTAGQVLVWNGALVMAYFHAHSAGTTEDPKDVWGGEVPYLSSKADPYSTPNKVYTWNGTVSAQSLTGQLGASRINSVNIGQRTAGGRARSLVFDTDAGRKELSGKPFRSILGKLGAQSSMFTVTLTGDNLVFSGTGAGHGVGLAQIGALQMAKQGKSYQEILKFYIPAAEIKKV